jgi:hypothetical protein
MEDNQTVKGKEIKIFSQWELCPHTAINVIYMESHAQIQQLHE